MKLVITPLVAAGPIRFGMSVAEVRAIVPDVATVFEKGLAPAHPTDAFDNIGVHVGYDAGGRCETIECWGASEPTFAGVNLLGVSFADARRILEQHDGQTSLMDVGAQSLALGISLYCPRYAEEPDSLVEGVLVFDRHVWDEAAVR